MSRSPTPLIGVIGVLTLVLAVGVVWITRGPDDSVTVEASHGITFLRNHGELIEDDVAHPGRLVVSDDGCLYVEPDDEEKTYLAALSPGTTVTQDGIELERGTLPFDTHTTFGRVSVDGSVPDDARDRCTGAEEAYGVG